MEFDDAQHETIMAMVRFSMTVAESPPEMQRLALMAIIRHCKIDRLELLSLYDEAKADEGKSFDGRSA